LFPRTEIEKSGSETLVVSDVPINELIILREAAASQSMCEG